MCLPILGVLSIRKKRLTYMKEKVEETDILYIIMQTI